MDNPTEQDFEKVKPFLHGWFVSVIINLRTHNDWVGAVILVKNCLRVEVKEAGNWVSEVELCRNPAEPECPTSASHWPAWIETFLGKPDLPLDPLL